MHRWRNVLLPLTALLIAGCSEGDPSESFHFDEGIEPGAESSPSTWAEIAPGVWERARPEGGFERMGFGRASFRFALGRARHEREVLLDPGSKVEPADLEQRLAKNADLIDHLQTTLEEAVEAVEEESIPLSADAVDSLALSSASTSGTPSGSVCAGSYKFGVQFFYGMVDGSVKTTASWTESGPYAPYKKVLHTYAHAWDTYGPPYDETDSDSVGPFAGTGYVGVSSYAGVGMTFYPALHGSAYLSVSNGCSAYRFYEASDH